MAGNLDYLRNISFERDRRSHMKKQLIAVASVLVLAMSLSACGGSKGAASNQTAEEACKVVETELSDFGTTFGNANSAMTADPAAAKKLMEDMNSSLKKAGEGITNEEISGLWKSFANDVDKVAGVVDSGDMEKITEITSDLMKSSLALGQACEATAK